MVSFTLMMEMLVLIVGHKCILASIPIQLKVCALNLRKGRKGRRQRIQKKKKRAKGARKKPRSRDKPDYRRSSKS